MYPQLLISTQSFPRKRKKEAFKLLDNGSIIKSQKKVKQEDDNQHCVKGSRLVNFILLCRNYAKGIYYMELCVIFKEEPNGGFKAFTEMCNDL